jgi:hypothetical protein
MTAKIREIELYVSADWERAYFDGPPRWMYAAGPVDAEGDRDDIYESGSSFADVMRRVLDEVFIRGYRRVSLVTDDDSDLCIMDGFFQSRRLYATPRRLSLLAEHQLVVAESKCEERKRKAREYRRLGLCRALQMGPTPKTIREFYSRWKKVSGYGVNDPHNWKPYLATAKEVLITNVVSRAKREGWTVGWAWDSFARASFSRIVYVDTPLGQVSFHVGEGTYSDLPHYFGSWSGIRNSDEILARLYAPDYVEKSAAA